MTDRADLSRANALHSEEQAISRALSDLDAGGAITMLMISSPDGGSTNLPAPPPPHDAALIADVQAALVARQAEIETELVALGVTGEPPEARTPAARARTPAPVQRRR